MTTNVQRDQGDDTVLRDVPRQLTQFLSRARLLGVLDAAASDGLVIVRAPGGAGKTTLVVDWLRKREDDRRVIWVSLDASARSGPGFWHLVGGALVTHGGASTLGPLGDLLSGFVDAGQAVCIILAEISALPAAVRLVLDDLHLVDDATIDELAWMLERSDRLQVLVTTRRRLPLEDARLAVRLEPTVVTGTQLAFDLDETVSVVERADSSLTAADAAIIHGATDGLPLATRVAIATFTRDFADDDSTALDHSVIVERVARHAARDLLPAFSDSTSRLAALHVALVPALDVALAEQLTGNLAVETTLREFERDGFGEFERRERGLVFSFHALVRAALEVQAEEHFAAEQLIELRRSAAEYFAATGNPLEALRLFARIGDTAQIWPLIGLNFSEMVNHHLAEAKEIFGTIPDGALLTEGTLAAAAVVILGDGEPVPSARVRQLAESALENLEPRRNDQDPLERFWITIARVGSLRAIRNLSDAATAADEVIESIDELTPERRAEIGTAIGAAMLQVVITYVLVGRFEDAITLAHRLANDPHPVRGQHRLSLLAYIQALRGEMNEAAEFAGAIAQDRVVTWRTSVQAVGWYAAETMLLLEQNRPREARAMMAALDGRISVLEQWPYLLWVNGTTRLAAGQADVGIDELNAALRENRSRAASSFALNLVGALRSDLYLAAGAPARAKVILGGRAPDAIPIVLAQARLDLADGNPEDAAHRLATLHWGDRGTPRQHAEALLLGAVSALRLGHPDEAALTASRAFAILEQRALRLPLIMVPRADLLEILGDRSPAHTAMLDGLADPFGRILSPVVLTKREQLVLVELQSDATVDLIAARLFISANTVKTHMKSLYRKLGAASREEAIAVGRQRGLLQL